MRVALCYRGHFYREKLHNNCNGRTGEGSSFFLNYENNKSNLIDCYDDVDVFFHTYSANEELNDKLITTLNPKKYEIETNEHSEIRHSILKVNEMFNSDDYDLIINTRFDLHFKKKITEFNLDVDKFNFLWRENVKKQKLLPSYRCSDLLWVFHPRYKKEFEYSYGSCYDKFFGNINPMRDGHTILKCLSERISVDTEINFVTHKRYTSSNKITNPFLLLNRSF